MLSSSTHSFHPPSYSPSPPWLYRTGNVYSKVEEKDEGDEKVVGASATSECIGCQGWKKKFVHSPVVIALSLFSSLVGSNSRFPRSSFSRQELRSSFSTLIHFIDHCTISLSHDTHSRVFEPSHHHRVENYTIVFILNGMKE